MAAFGQFWPSARFWECTILASAFCPKLAVKNVNVLANGDFRKKWPKADVR
jgi:hypothetical protein